MRKSLLDLAEKNCDEQKLVHKFTLQKQRNKASLHKMMVSRQCSVKSAFSHQYKVHAIAQAPIFVLVPGKQSQRFAARWLGDRHYFNAVIGYQRLDDACAYAAHGDS